jgi:hypothetical protein
MTQTEDAPSSQARKHLEEWQKQVYQTLGLSPPASQQLELLIESEMKKRATLLNPKSSADESEAYLRRKIKEIQSLLKAAPPTRFEDIPAYINLLILADQIEEGARQGPGPVDLIRPIFGTIPGGGVNALILRDGAEYIVAFSAGLFSFAELMARSVARTVQSTSASEDILPSATAVYGFSTNAEALEESIKRDSEGAKCFAEALLSYVRWGRPDSSAMPKLDPVEDSLASILYRHFLQFVIAHEYGHLFHKHLSDQDAVGEPQSGIGARTVMWNWQKEAEADVAGCGLMFAAATATPDNLPAVLMGIEVFLTCHEALDRALSLLCVGDEDHWVAGRHPPARTRRAFLHSHLISRSDDLLGGPDAEAQMRAGLQQATWLSRLLEIFWAQTRPYLWQMYELGLDPSPIFKRVSDAKHPNDPAMLGELRNLVKNLFQNVFTTLERAETLVVGGKRLMRASASAGFKSDSKNGMTQDEIDEAKVAIGEALMTVGGALEATALGELRPVLLKGSGNPLDLFQTATDRIVLAGAKLKAAALNRSKAAVLHEGAKLIHEAGQTLSLIGELSGVGLHLMQMGECLGLAGEALARDQLKACWRATKLAGCMTVLSAECLIRGTIELWKTQILIMTGGTLFSVAAALRQSQPPNLEMLRDVLSLYKEAEYAMLGSLRRSAAFLQNVDVPIAESAATFRQAASVLKDRAAILGRAARSVADAESALNERRQAPVGVNDLEDVGRILESAGTFLGEAALQEQSLMQESAVGHLGIVLSLAGRNLVTQNPTQAAQLIAGLAEKLLHGS